MKLSMNLLSMTLQIACVRHARRRKSSKFRQNPCSVVFDSLDNLFFPVIGIESNPVKRIQPVSTVEQVFVHATIVAAEGTVK
jgi:hypothetical protein